MASARWMREALINPLPSLSRNLKAALRSSS
eukprot:CAMPEP_0172040172 /NCGR_PEP_ID=MMETSP1041-20130122/24340_1 /TAXON_ID=464988 /ORGANISM="Hemiselmis andersenii, Strain CCMP439" /LENGTH=30 /DNA_ID= /DNA_START= /DNA_END= /DNA_ORIENTATION=